MTKSAKVLLVDALATQLREVDFSWWELEQILRRTMNKALQETGTEIVRAKPDDVQMELEMELETA